MNLGPTSESLSPPEQDVDDSNEAVVEHEWEQVEKTLQGLSHFSHPSVKGAVKQIKSSLQTIRELTEARK